MVIFVERLVIACRVTSLGELNRNIIHTATANVYDTLYYSTGGTTLLMITNFSNIVKTILGRPHSIIIRTQTLVL